MAKKNSNPMKALVLYTITIFILVSAVVIYNTIQNKESGDVALAELPPIENQPTLGDPNAPVSVVEFADYKCPACREWTEYIFPQLKKEFIDTGEITLSYINVLFHKEESVLGSLAGEAVWNQDPDAFWDFHKALLKEQPSSQDHDNAWITPEKIMEVAKATVPQIDLGQLEQDIVNETYQDDVLLDDQLVKEFKVELTPSIVINGTMVEDPFDYERIKEVIEDALSK